MKKKIVKALTLLCFMAGFMLQANAQNVTLVVTNTNGSEQTYQLTEESQLHFENGERLVIETANGSNVTLQLSDIRKIVCSEMVGTEETAASKLQLLPNPSHNQVILKNLSGNCQGHIYTLDGRMVKAFEASEGMMLDISDLSEGMYLLNIDGQTLKLMKL
ncbi:MAG: T9SS type A sorting domain-containing protein [Bacteroidales bacterium]|nr:T9SS type A sorting domain-containing protein [Bacteroidales bacterium]